MVKSNGPVLAQEFRNVGDDALVISGCQLVEIVLVKTNKAPKTLQDDFLAAHVGHTVNQADAVESKLDEVPYVISLQVVADEIWSILYFTLALIHIGQSRFLLV